MPHNAWPAAAWRVLVVLCLVFVVHFADPDPDSLHSLPALRLRAC